MKIVDDSGSDIEDLIQTAEKTEGRHSAVKEPEHEKHTEGKEEEKSINPEVSEPMSLKNSSDESFEEKVKAPKQPKSK